MNHRIIDYPDPTYGELRQQLDRAIEDRRKLDRELENTRGQLGLIRGELGIVKEQRNHHREKLTEARSQLESAVDRCARLRNELESAKDRCARLIKLLNATRDDRASVSASLTDARERLRKLREELTEAQRQTRGMASLQREVDRLREHRDQVVAKLHEAKSRLRIDGQLLTDLIIGACPIQLTDEAAARIARDAVDELVRVGPGVTVFRGHPDNPWLLRSDVDSPGEAGKRSTYTDGCAAARADEVVDATILDGPAEVQREVQYAVLTGSTDAEHLFCVAEAGCYAAARAIASRLPGCWVGQRIVITQRWTPVDTDDPIR